MDFILDILDPVIKDAQDIAAGLVVVGFFVACLYVVCKVWCAADRAIMRLFDRRRK